MTSLTHIPPSQAHRDAIRRSGFDLDDPHRRHPVHNQILDRLKGRAAPMRDARADQLLRARQGQSKDLVRGLAWLAPIGLAAFAPGHAKALEWPPEEIVPAMVDAKGGDEIVQTTETTSPFADFVFAAPSLADPVWPPVLLIALLSVMFLSFLKLRKLTRHIEEALTMNAQPSLFDADPIPAIVDGSRNPLTLWRLDGASRVGKVRKENQDAFATWDRVGTGPIMVLCDGAGGVEGGKEASENATQSIMASLKRALRDPAAGPDTGMLERALKEARIAAARKKLSGVTTAIVAVLCGDHLLYATLGDGALAVIWPDGMVTQLLAPHHTAGMPPNVINAYIGGGCDVTARTGSVRLEPGCTVMLMSDGASDLFPFDAFALAHDQQIDAWKNNGQLADRLLAEIEAARDPKTDAYLHHDNMTLIAAHCEPQEVTDA